MQAIEWAKCLGPGPYVISGKTIQYIKCAATQSVIGVFCPRAGVGIDLRKMKNGCC